LIRSTGSVFMSGAPPLSVHTRAHYTRGGGGGGVSKRRRSERISSGALIKGNKKGGRCVTERLLLSLGLGRRTQWTSPLLDPRRRRPHHLLQRSDGVGGARVNTRSDGRTAPAAECSPLPPLRSYHLSRSLAHSRPPARRRRRLLLLRFFPIASESERERRNRRRRPNRGKCSGSVHRADHRASPFTISRSLSCHRWHLVTSHLPIVTSNLF
jgi:hypothetical protein